MLWKNPKHSQADQAPKIPYKYTATRHKNMGQKFKSLVWGYNDVAHATPNVEREAETRRGMKNSVICLSTGGVPKLLIENAKPFLQECVCVCVYHEGDGGLTDAWWEGTGPSTLLGLPIGYFAHCPLAFTSSLRPFPFLLSFTLSGRVHFESCPLWRVKGLTC